MPKLRVLILDEGVVARQALADLIDQSPGLEVASTAPSAAVAVDKLQRAFPDVVLLGADVPEKDALEALAALRQARPALALLLVRRPSPTASAVLASALARGATDCFFLPEGAPTQADAFLRAREPLLDRIKLVASGQRFTPAPRASLPRAEVIVVAASTGGPAALSAVLSALPPTFSVPMLIVQHMPPPFPQFLAERLGKHSALLVREARAGERLRPGEAWLAPGGHHLALERRADGALLTTHLGPPENSCRPSADVLFRSAVEVYGAGVLAVVLTGMGQDGLKGCECVRQAGGQILVQDEASSVVWGMPGHVARAGLQDAILPPDRIGAELVRLVCRGRSHLILG